MHACRHACMHACTYVCIYIYTYMYIYIYTSFTLCVKCILHIIRVAFDTLTRLDGKRPEPTRKPSCRGRLPVFDVILHAAHRNKHMGEIGGALHRISMVLGGPCKWQFAWSGARCYRTSVQACTAMLPGRSLQCEGQESDVEWGRCQAWGETVWPHTAPLTPEGPECQGGGQLCQTQLSSASIPRTHVTSVWNSSLIHVTT